MPEDVRPFCAFRFAVTISVDGFERPLCEAAFSECDGLEMTMQPKTIREGGNNAQPIHLSGPVAYGNLTLKRGMTSTFDLWKWFESTLTKGKYGLRGDAVVNVLASDDREESKVQASFVLTRCLPIKLKAPALNAISGQLAIEEMQIAYETLTLKLASAT